jgi:glutaminase
MSKLENPEILPPALLDILQELHSQYKSLKDGVVANYIPELAKVNPDLFSLTDRSPTLTIPERGMNGA